MLQSENPFASVERCVSNKWNAITMQVAILCFNKSLY